MNVSLKEYFETKLESLEKTIDEHDRLNDIRFKTSEVAVNAALVAQKEGVAAAFLASEKAIVKAEEAQKDYNNRSNEFRGQLDDQAKTLMPRPETIGLLKGVDDKIEAQQRQIDATNIAAAKIEGKASQSTATVNLIIAVFGILIGIAAIVISLVH